MLTVLKRLIRYLVRQNIFQQHTSLENEVRRQIMLYTTNCIVHENLLIFSVRTTAQEDNMIFNYLRRMKMLQRYEIVYISDKKFKKVQRTTDPQRIRRLINPKPTQK